MTHAVKVKICGLCSRDDVGAAVAAGASYIGLNFFPSSPRYVSCEQAAELAKDIPKPVTIVGLAVNAGDHALDKIVATVPLDMLQLHGNETPERIHEIKKRYNLPVMKAVGVATAKDLECLPDFFSVSDQILLDTKPPNPNSIMGGGGKAFDWRLIADQSWPLPWMLAGGLTSTNVTEALRVTGAKQIDLASGVEREPRKKDSDLMLEFIRAVANVKREQQ
ncbi:MAG: phosphoribosylanthranilate isomerase [Aestuariivita sp.]|nr:phosphoribosylanthranilate isomerase [Aestuariivita sp.]MCY4201493.1 phosphoribosylanthranilate isomerase [Aestuariivita sp.]